MYVLYKHTMMYYTVFNFDPFKSEMYTLWFMLMSLSPDPGFAGQSEY